MGPAHAKALGQEVMCRRKRRAGVVRANKARGAMVPAAAGENPHLCGPSKRLDS